jgi:hypothetical protein
VKLRLILNGLMNCVILLNNLDIVCGFWVKEEAIGYRRLSVTAPMPDNFPDMAVMIGCVV